MNHTHMMKVEAVYQLRLQGEATYQPQLLEVEAVNHQSSLDCHKFKEKQC